MSISEKSKELIKSMKEVQLLENGESDIEIFKNALNYFKSEKNVDIIPYLCSIMNDDAVMASPVEAVLKTILYIVENNNFGVEKGIAKVFEGTYEMVSNGHDWALMLHMQFIINSDLLKNYISSFEQLETSKKKFMLALLEELKEEDFFEEPDLSEIIKKLQLNC